MYNDILSQISPLRNPDLRDHAVVTDQHRTLSSGFVRVNVRGKHDKECLLTIQLWKKVLVHQWIDLNVNAWGECDFYNLVLIMLLGSGGYMQWLAGGQEVWRRSWFELPSHWRPNRIPLPTHEYWHLHMLWTYADFVMVWFLYNECNGCVRTKSCFDHATTSWECANGMAEWH